MRYYFSYVSRWTFFATMFLLGLSTCFPMLWINDNTWLWVFIPTALGVAIITKKIKIFLIGAIASIPLYAVFYEMTWPIVLFFLWVYIAVKFNIWKHEENKIYKRSYACSTNGIVVNVIVGIVLALVGFCISLAVVLIISFLIYGFQL